MAFRLSWIISTTAIASSNGGALPEINDLTVFSAGKGAVWSYDDAQFIQYRPVPDRERGPILVLSLGDTLLVKAEYDAYGS